MDHRFDIKARFLKPQLDKLGLKYGLKVQV